MLDQTSHELDQLPEGSILRSVTAIPAEVAGRKALRIELTDDVTFNGKPGVDYIDKPTFVIIPASLTSGTIEVDVLSRLNNKGPAEHPRFRWPGVPDRRWWRRFRSDLPAPPQWTQDQSPQSSRPARRPVLCLPRPFDRLRTEYPDGRYEAPADIGPDEWINLRDRTHRNWRRRGGQRHSSPEGHRDQGGAHDRCRRPIRRHRQRVILLQTDNQTALRPRRRGPQRSEDTRSGRRGAGHRDIQISG